MQTGKVKWFDAAKRYGFIASDDGGPDIFLHLSNIADPACPVIEPGLRLQFIVERKGDKLTARQASVMAANDVMRPAAAFNKDELVEFNDAFEKEWGLRPT